MLKIEHLKKSYESFSLDCSLEVKKGHVTGLIGQNGAGKVRGSAQEGANVDLSVEFVDLMLYQRGFQGNAKVIKISDEVLNEVVNLIR